MGPLSEPKQLTLSCMHRDGVRGSGGKVPLVTNLVTQCRWMVCFTHQSFTTGKCLWYTWNGNLEM